MRTVAPSVDRASRSTGTLIGAAVVYALIALAAAVQNRSRPRASELSHGARSREPNDNSAVWERDDEPERSQDERPRQDGRGRRAAVPWHIPWLGGRTYCSALTTKSARTDCWPSPLEWCFMDCLHSSQL